MDTFGERLRILRKKNNFTQKALALELGLKHHNAVSNWEKNISKPEAETLIKLSELLQVSSDLLLGIKAYPTKEEKSHVTIAMEDYVEYLSLKNEKLKQENQSLKENNHTIPEQS